MIVKQYIKDFEKLGFGMFVHFGMYSMFEHGEWIRTSGRVTDEEYFAVVFKRQMNETPRAYMKRLRNPGTAM